MKRFLMFAMVAVAIATALIDAPAEAGPFKKLFGRETVKQPASTPTQCKPGMPCYTGPTATATPGSDPGVAHIGGNQSIIWDRAPDTLPGTSTVQATAAPQVMLSAVDPQVPLSQSVPAPTPPATQPLSAQLAAADQAAAAALAHRNQLAAKIAELEPTPAPPNDTIPAPTVPRPAGEQSVLQADTEARVNRFIDVLAKRLGVEKEVDPPQTPARDILDRGVVYTFSATSNGQTETATLDTRPIVREWIGTATAAK